LFVMESADSFGWLYVLVGLLTGGLGLAFVNWLVRRATREPTARTPANAPAPRDRSTNEPSASDQPARDSSAGKQLAKTAARAAATRSRTPAGTEPPPSPRHALILASEVHAQQLGQAIPESSIRVKDAAELVAEAARHPSAVAFVDVELLPELTGKLANIPVVAIVNPAPGETLATIVGLLGQYPSLAHVIVASLLSQPLGRSHLKGLMQRLAGEREHDLLDTASVGRVAMLAKASHREARFERIQDYFAKQGMSSRTTLAIYEVAEELVMNALYNAPSEGGYFKAPVSRSEDVTLPLDRACEISYGIENGIAFVRLRDTFGALRHERLLEVLSRCNNAGVALDESRGGAGLGMWRVFSAATTIAITVIPGRLTDILVRMAPKTGRSAKQLLAVDLYFLPDSHAEAQQLIDQNDSLLDHSITLIQQS